jgi:hypothetical protein
MKCYCFRRSDGKFWRGKDGNGKPMWGDLPLLFDRDDQAVANVLLRQNFLLKDHVLVEVDTELGTEFDFAFIFTPR